MGCQLRPHILLRGNSLETPNVWGLSSFHPNVSKQPPPPQCLGFCLLFTSRLLSRRAGSDVDATAAAHRTRKPRRCHVITGQNKDFSSLKGECHSHLPPTVDYFLFLELYSRRVSAEGSGGERERWPRGNWPAARGSGGREIEIYAALFLTFLSHLSLPDSALPVPARSLSQISFSLFPCPSMFLPFLPSPLAPLTSSCSVIFTLATLVSLSFSLSSFLFSLSLSLYSSYSIFFSTSVVEPPLLAGNDHHQSLRSSGYHLGW